MPSSPLATDPVSSPTIGTLSAQQEGRYLIAPQAPYTWVDQPPSVNQLLGALWVAESLYPDAYDIDLPAEVVSFYQTFYGVDLGTEDATLLLKEANTPGL
ncbi:hypothetical protein [Ornithinicoccus hortensis]|uniref:hypothetical protein n=1 Tax=Ornithinicoccus hortensis TaxID=82346 RepID=UPI0011500DC3|nr:hypothetical protein [Ornithinicoccus hortensis]